jgi:hypothetical protein
VEEAAVSFRDAMERIYGKETAHRICLAMAECDIPQDLKSVFKNIDDPKYQHWEHLKW